MAAETEGLEQVESTHSMEETAHRVLSLWQEKRIKVFAVVDQGGEAEAAPLTLRPTKSLIFGSPKAGTLLIEAAHRGD